MVAHYVNELPEDLQVLLAMRSTFQVWFDTFRYLQEVSNDNFHVDGVNWGCTSNTFNITVLRPSGHPFVSLHFTVADNGLELTLVAQSYSHGKLVDTKMLKGVAFTVEDFKVLLSAIPQTAYISLLRSLSFFFALIGLESQFQGYQHRFAVLNGWIEG